MRTRNNLSSKVSLKSKTFFPAPQLKVPLGNYFPILYLVSHNMSGNVFGRKKTTALSSLHVLSILSKSLIRPRCTASLPYWYFGFHRHVWRNMVSVQTELLGLPLLLCHPPSTPHQPSDSIWTQKWWEQDKFLLRWPLGDKLCAIAKRNLTLRMPVLTPEFLGMEWVWRNQCWPKSPEEWVSV